MICAFALGFAIEESAAVRPEDLQPGQRGLPWNAEVQAAGVTAEVAALRAYLPRQVQRRTVQLADQPHLRTDGVRVAGARLAAAADAVLEHLRRFAHVAHHHVEIAVAVQVEHAHADARCACCPVPTQSQPDPRAGPGVAALGFSTPPCTNES